MTYLYGNGINDVLCGHMTLQCQVSLWKLSSALKLFSKEMLTFMGNDGVRTSERSVEEDEIGTKGMN
jgi:hypothetical protein